MARRGFRTILAYLDNFLMTGDTRQKCELAYYELMKLLTELGFNINWEKAVASTFLGIEIDTVLRQLCLPDSKLCELRQLLSDTLLKRSITKRELDPIGEPRRKIKLCSTCSFRRPDIPAANNRCHEHFITSTSPRAH